MCWYLFRFFIDILLSFNLLRDLLDEMLLLFHKYSKECLHCGLSHVLGVACLAEKLY